MKNMTNIKSDLKFWEKKIEAFKRDAQKKLSLCYDRDDTENGEAYGNIINAIDPFKFFKKEV